MRAMLWLLFLLRYVWFYMFVVGRLLSDSPVRAQWVEQSASVMDFCVYFADVVIRV